MLQAKDITMGYGKKEVLKGIDLEISTEPNEIVGLLAANGEGKTTLLRILGGIYHNYKGTLMVDGVPMKASHKNKITYMNDTCPFPTRWKMEDALKYYKKYFKGYNEEKARLLCKKLDVVMDRKISKLSRGEIEKGYLAITLGIDADIYLFDEPLAAIDIITREEILKTLLKDFTEGSTMIISTHLIQDVETLFDRVWLLKEGKIVENEAVEAIREKGLSVVDFYKQVYKGVSHEEK